MLRNPGSRHEAPAKLSMTPMIDVVFLLLVFFLLALEPLDTLSELGARSPGTPLPGDTVTINQIDIRLDRDGYSLRGRRMDNEAMSAFLSRQAELDAEQPVLIHCTGDTPHRALVQLLDICAGRNLNRIAIVPAR